MEIFKEYTIDEETGEAVKALHDISESGKEIPWDSKKLRTRKLIKILEVGGDRSRATKIKTCGSWLEFRVGAETGTKKLNHAQFCKDRLCPMCGWRRSLKLGAEMQDMMAIELSEHPERRFLFLTLTVKNCAGGDLRAVIGRVMKAFAKLQQHRKFKRSTAGWYRALEVTYNSQTDTYHPHLHVLLVVENNEYFSKENVDYLSKDYIIKAWKESLGVGYAPSVDIQAVSEDATAEGAEQRAKAICEVTKYTVKDSSYSPPDLSMMKKYEVVETLEWALKGKRIIAFGGELKDIRRRLKLGDDSLDGDLIHTNGKPITEEEVRYYIGYSWYPRMDMYIEKYRSERSLFDADEKERR